MPSEPDWNLLRSKKPGLSLEHISEIGDFSSTYLQSEASEFSENDLIANLQSLYQLSKTTAKVSKKDARKIQEMVISAFGKQIRSGYRFRGPHEQSNRIFPTRRYHHEEETGGGGRWKREEDINSLLDRLQSLCNCKIDNPGVILALAAVQKKIGYNTKEYLDAAKKTYEVDKLKKGAPKEWYEMLDARIWEGLDREGAVQAFDRILTALKEKTIKDDRDWSEGYAPNLPQLDEDKIIKIALKMASAKLYKEAVDLLDTNLLLDSPDWRFDIQKSPRVMPPRLKCDGYIGIAEMRIKAEGNADNEIEKAIAEARKITGYRVYTAAEDRCIAFCRIARLKMESGKDPGDEIRQAIAEAEKMLPELALHAEKEKAEIEKRRKPSKFQVNQDLAELERLKLKELADLTYEMNDRKEAVGNDQYIELYIATKMAEQKGFGNWESEKFLEKSLSIMRDYTGTRYSWKGDILEKLVGFQVSAGLHGEALETIERINNRAGYEFNALLEIAAAQRQAKLDYHKAYERAHALVTKHPQGEIPWMHGFISLAEFEIGDKQSGRERASRVLDEALNAIQEHELKMTKFLQNERINKKGETFVDYENRTEIASSYVKIGEFEKAAELLDSKGGFYDAVVEALKSADRLNTDDMKAELGTSVKNRDEERIKKLALIMPEEELALIGDPILREIALNEKARIIRQYRFTL